MMESTSQLVKQLLPTLLYVQKSSAAANLPQLNLTDEQRRLADNSRTRAAKMATRSLTYMIADNTALFLEDDGAAPLARMFETIIEDHSMTPDDFLVAATVSACGGPVKIARLSRATKLDKKTVAAALNKLCGAGYLKAIRTDHGLRYEPQETEEQSVY